MLWQMVLLHFFHGSIAFPCVCVWVCVCVCVCVCIYIYISHHILFIHSCVDGHIHCFYILTVVNSVAMNIVVHATFWITVFVFSRYMSRSGIAGSYGNSNLSFLSNFELFSIMAALVYIPNNILGGFPFLHTLSIFIICRFSDDSDFDQSEVIPHWGFDLHFSN